MEWGHGRQSSLFKDTTYQRQTGRHGRRIHLGYNQEEISTGRRVNRRWKRPILRHLPRTHDSFSKT